VRNVGSKSIKSLLPLYGLLIAAAATAGVISLSTSTPNGENASLGKVLKSAIDEWSEHRELDHYLDSIEISQARSLRGKGKFLLTDQKVPQYKVKNEIKMLVPVDDPFETPTSARGKTKHTTSKNRSPLLIRIRALQGEIALGHPPDKPPVIVERDRGTILETYRKRKVFAGQLSSLTGEAYDAVVENVGTLDSGNYFVTIEGVIEKDGEKSYALAVSLEKNGFAKTVGKATTNEYPFYKTPDVVEVADNSDAVRTFIAEAGVLENLSNTEIRESIEFLFGASHQALAGASPTEVGSLQTFQMSDEIQGAVINQDKACIEKDENDPKGGCISDCPNPKDPYKESLREEYPELYRIYQYERRCMPGDTVA